MPARMPLSRSAAAMALGLVCTCLQAADATYTQSAATQYGTRQTTAANGQSLQGSATQVNAYEQMQAQMWGLSLDEVRRAELLMKGPRGAFSAPNITPVEVLGIHARSEAERQKYAEQFARILHADTERVLAWTVAHAQAMARLYPNEPVMDFNASVRTTVDPSVAEAAMVPQSAINKPVRRPATGSKTGSGQR